MKFGKLGRLDHDPIRVATVRPHVIGAHAPLPAAIQDARSKIQWTPSLVQNDALPTCTVAGLINSARWWALLHGFDLTNQEAAELAFFAAVAGVQNTEAAIASVPGLVMLNVLMRAQRYGFAAGGPTALVPEYTSLQSIDGITDAISTKGSAYLGVSIYEADMRPGAVWQGGIQNAGKLEGGHAIVAIDNQSDEFTIATWGGTVQANAEWLEARVDEAYAIHWTFPVSA
jgi:hypothetical protein